MAMGLPDDSTNLVVSFGQVPLFFYLIHLPFIQGIFIITLWYPSVINILFFNDYFPREIHPLPFLYSLWIIVILLLYIPCKWFKK